MSLDGTAPETMGAAAAQPFQHLLFVWLSPSFPTGAFAYSHGLEMAADRGLVRNQFDLQTWLASLIAVGSLHNDLIILAASHRATAAYDRAKLAAINELALAMQPSAERYLETTQQGGSFLTGVATSWPHPNLTTLRTVLVSEVAYPVALGLAAASHAIPLEITLEAFTFAFLGNLTSAAIRLSLIGQTAAQDIIAALTPALRAAASTAQTSTLDNLGSSTFSADLCSLEHETLYSRLFRS